MTTFQISPDSAQADQNISASEIQKSASKVDNNVIIKISEWINLHKTLMIILLIPLCFNVAIYFINKNNQIYIEGMEIERNLLTEEIGAIEEDIAFLVEYEAKHAVLTEILNQPPPILNVALNTINAHAQAHGLISIDYEVLEEQRLWSHESRSILQTGIRFDIESNNENQALAFLRDLETNWGGRIHIEQLEIIRPSNMEANHSTALPLIQTRGTLQWRRLQALVDSP